MDQDPAKDSKSFFYHDIDTSVQKAHNMFRDTYQAQQLDEQQLLDQHAQQQHEQALNMFRNTYQLFPNQAQQLREAKRGSGIQLQDLSDEKSEGDFASSVSSCKPDVGPVETSVEAKRGCFDVKQQLVNELSAYGHSKKEFESVWRRLNSSGLVAAGSSGFKLTKRSLDVADYERGLESSKYEEAMKKHVDVVKNGRLEIDNLIFNFNKEIKTAEKKKKKLEQEEKKKLKPQGKKKK